MIALQRFVKASMAGLALAASMAGWLSCAGCSCRESEPAQPVEVRQVPAKAAAAQPAQPPAAQGAQTPKGERRVGDSLLYAPGDYMRTVVVTVPRRARRDIDTAFIQNEVSQFRAMEGRFPKTLDELVQWRGSPLPDTPRGCVYSYDPATGKVEVVEQE